MYFVTDSAKGVSPKLFAMSWHKVFFVFLLCFLKFTKKSFLFAIIDIETTGGRAQGDKITEICILVHDGLSVVEEFTTLINPECRISSQITRLTGITNEMVANAPKFYEVAKRIVELTKDCVFVAHNVQFDYGFIKQEFKTLGYEYRRDTLCTVRLSRKLIPGKISYSLGRLCESLGIAIEGRHRAAGDARAAAILFNLLLRLKSENPQYRRQDITEINTTRVDKIKTYILKKLPEETGVYYFLDKDGNILYIGKSNNMYSRALSHFNSKEQKGKRLLNQLMNVDFVLTGAELPALLFESEEIKKHFPPFNRARKNSSFTHFIESYVQDEIIRFRLVGEEEVTAPLEGFTSYAAARERLDYYIDCFSLCLRYCGLTDEESVCFNHQIKKCHGICEGKEMVSDYNERARKVLDTYQLPHENFVLLDKGRKSGEQSFVWVKGGRYAGFGYLDEQVSIQHPDDLKDYLFASKYFPDADNLIRTYLRQGKGRLKPLPVPVQREDNFYSDVQL
jgi:DNA polymerase III subunit epsilon